MRAVKVWFENERIYITTDDGSTLWQSMWYYNKLCRASEEERQRFELGENGIRWDELDEDVTYESFEYDDPEPMDVPGKLQQFTLIYNKLLMKGRKEPPVREVPFFIYTNSLLRFAVIFQVFPNSRARLFFVSHKEWACTLAKEDAVTGTTIFYGTIEEIRSFGNF